MTCKRCKDEDTDKCIDCQDPDRDEMVKQLQEELKREDERIGGKPIDKGRVKTDILLE